MLILLIEKNKSKGMIERISMANQGKRYLSAISYDLFHHLNAYLSIFYQNIVVIVVGRAEID